MLGYKVTRIAEKLMQLATTLFQWMETHPFMRTFLFFIDVETWSQHNLQFALLAANPFYLEKMHSDTI